MAYNSLPEVRPRRTYKRRSPDKLFKIRVNALRMKIRSRAKLEVKLARMSKNIKSDKTKLVNSL